MITALAQLPIEIGPIALHGDLEVDQVDAELDEALAGTPLGAYLRARQHGAGPGDRTK